MLFKISNSRMKNLQRSGFRDLRQTQFDLCTSSAPLARIAIRHACVEVHRARQPGQLIAARRG